MDFFNTEILDDVPTWEAANSTTFRGPTSPDLKGLPGYLERP